MAAFLLTGIRLRENRQLLILGSMKRLISALLILAFSHGSTHIYAEQESGSNNGKNANAPFVKNVQAEEADQVLKKEKQIVILDIRTPAEFKSGHLSHAKNIDFYESDFQKNLESLDKKKTYLVHCASGGRSAKARDLMKNLGFLQIYHLDDGIKGWINAGKPVEK